MALTVNAELVGKRPSQVATCERRLFSDALLELPNAALFLIDNIETSGVLTSKLWSNVESLSLGLPRGLGASQRSFWPHHSPDLTPKNRSTSNVKHRVGSW